MGHPVITHSEARAIRSEDCLGSRRQIGGYPMILITGASGTNGREIVKQLSAKGLQFRAMVRQLPAPVLQLPNVEYVVGDFTDLSSIRLALAGIDEAFLLSSSTAGQVERETNFMRMASEAMKLSRFVRQPVKRLVTVRW